MEIIYKNDIYLQYISITRIICVSSLQCIKVYRTHDELCNFFLNNNLQCYTTVKKIIHIFIMFSRN